MKTALLVISLVALCSQRLVAETAYFVVSYPPCDTNYFGPETTNAYILPINQPADIVKARLLAATCGAYPGGGSFRPLFMLGVGGDGTNRNVALPAQPLWSWHVSEFVHWTGFTSPEYPYTHPWEIERDVLNGTLTNGTQLTLKGYYTVIAEVNPPLKLFSILDQSDFILYWTHDASNTTYTVEWTQSLTNPQWKNLDQIPPPAPNVTPFVTLGPKAFEVPLNPAENYFFRLRLDPKPAGL